MSYDAYSPATTRRLVKPAIISAAYAYDLKFSCALYRKSQGRTILNNCRHGYQCYACGLRRITKPQGLRL